MALLGAAPDAACLSRWAANTSDARQRILSCGGLNLSVYALGSSLPESAHRSRYVRKVAGAFSPRAITSEKNKKRLNRHTISVDQLRRVGSGSQDRYSRWTLAYSFCTTQECASRKCQAEAAVPFADGKGDTANIHPSFSFYHKSFRFAILFTSNSFIFPENKHYPKPEISARADTSVEAGNNASIYSNEPYPLDLHWRSRTTAPSGSASNRASLSTHPA